MDALLKSKDKKEAEEEALVVTVFNAGEKIAAIESKKQEDASQAEDILIALDA